MTNCTICKTCYNNKLRQFCPTCGASSPVLSRIVGRIFNRSFVEVTK